MAVDPTFTTDTEVRLLAIERALTDIWRMMRFVINKEQFNRLNAIRQKELDLIDTRLDVIDAAILTLQEQYDNLL